MAEKWFIFGYQNISFWKEKCIRCGKLFLRELLVDRLCENCRRKNVKNNQCFDVRNAIEYDNCCDDSLDSGADEVSEENC